MSVLGWVSQNDSAEHDGVDTVDDTFNSDNANGEEGDRNSSDSASDTESEYDVNDPPMSLVSYEDVEMTSTSTDNFHTFPTSEAIESCSSHPNRDSLFCDAPIAIPLDPSLASTNPTVVIESDSVENGQLDQTAPALPDWHGFKLVGDNIDKNVRPSFSRTDKNTQSLHCFHNYAVLDRVNFSSLSDVTPRTQVDAEKLLISQDDVAQLESDAITLISR